MTTIDLKHRINLNLFLMRLIMASVAIRCSVSSTGEENCEENLDPRICVSIYRPTARHSEITTS